MKQEKEIPADVIRLVTIAIKGTASRDGGFVDYEDIAKAFLVAIDYCGIIAALRCFDEAMRNGSLGPDAEKHRRSALRGAHRKARKALEKQP